MLKQQWNKMKRYPHSLYITIVVNMTTSRHWIWIEWHVTEITLLLIILAWSIHYTLTSINGTLTASAPCRRLWGLLVDSRTNQIADSQLADWSTRGHLLNKHGVRELTRYHRGYKATTKTLLRRESSRPPPFFANARSHHNAVCNVCKNIPSMYLQQHAEFKAIFSRDCCHDWF